MQGSVISENHSLHILQKMALRLITTSRYISHTEPLCKELRVLKVFDMVYVAIWKFYYKLMHNDLPEYFSTMKPILPTVCRRYEIRAPVFHLPVNTSHICRTFYSFLIYKTRIHVLL